MPVIRRLQKGSNMKVGPLPPQEMGGATVAGQSNRGSSSTAPMTKKLTPQEMREKQERVVLPLR